MYISTTLAVYLYVEKTHGLFLLLMLNSYLISCCHAISDNACDHEKKNKLISEFCFQKSNRQNTFEYIKPQ